MFIKAKKNVINLTVLCTLIFSSCVSSKKVIYFNDLKDTASLGDASIAKSAFENKIQKNDQLSIVVSGSNTADLAILNAAGGMSQTGGSASIGSGPVSGYLVESDGTIKVPYIGKIKAEGLTRQELEVKLTEIFKEYTKNPIVNVRFINYSYYVLGEVNRSGKFTMGSERTTLLEAIGLAGDLTEFGKRDNVLLIREENGKRVSARLNLLSKDIFTSPYFYLKTNDVVYVEPVNAKFISRTGIPQYLSIIAVGLSLLLTIITVRNL